MARFLLISIVLFSVAISYAGAAATIDGGGGQYQLVNECAGSSFGGGGAPSADSSDVGDFDGSSLQRLKEELPSPYCLKQLADNSPNWLLGLILIAAIIIGWKFHNLIVKFTATIAFALGLLLGLAKFEVVKLPLWAEESAVSVLELGRLD